MGSDEGDRFMFELGKQENKLNFQAIQQKKKKKNRKSFIHTL